MPKGFGPQTAMTPGKTGINLPNNVFFRNLAWTLWAPIGFTTASIEVLFCFVLLEGAPETTGLSQTLLVLRVIWLLLTSYYLDSSTYFTFFVCPALYRE